MTARGYSARPVLLGRSRGGLMTLSWAAKWAEKVSPLLEQQAAGKDR